METLAETQPVRVDERPDAEYFAAHGLSNSGMKDLAVSPLRYWHLHINPNRPEPRTTPEMTFGSALHCAVLEPDKFPLRYAREIDASDFDGCLVTMDDLRAFLKARGIAPKGTRKADLIGVVQSVDPDAPILDVLQERHAVATQGKTVLSPADWARVARAAEALGDEAALMDILTDGCSEMPMFVKDPETGVMLKAKMDFVSSRHTVDLKTFSQKRGTSIDESITHAIWYEGYHIQAYFYSLVRSLVGGLKSPAKAPPFIFAFVESEEPHEVRLRSMSAYVGRDVNMLWERARIIVTERIRQYAEYCDRFGVEPWREPRGVDPLEDMEFPKLAY